MSPLRLLTTGKSLVSFNEAEPQYRVTRERLLPQFGPARNPFVADRSEAARPETRKINECSAVPRQPLTKRTPLPASNPSGCPGVERSKLAAFPTGPGGLSFKGVVRLRAAAFVTAWVQKLRALFLLSRGAPAKKAAFSGPTSLPVQGELSLDRIKVVRNDLSDADLEIVPLKTPTPRGGAIPGLKVVERTAQGGMAWGRFSGLFRAGKR